MNMYAKNEYSTDPRVVQSIIDVTRPTNAYTHVFASDVKTDSVSLGYEREPHPALIL